MKKTSPSTKQKELDELAPKYEFDYSKARPNRFAPQSSENRLIVVVEKDLAKVFKTSEAVNRALRALLDAVPRATKQKSTTN